MPAKSRFTRLDAFTKTVEDARIRTTSGGIVTIVSLLTILWLVWGEWSDYRRIEIRPELIVDKSRGDKMEIHMNISFPQMPCTLLTLDIMDVSGDVQAGVMHGIKKHRLAPVEEGGHVIDTEHMDLYEEGAVHLDPAYCGECYGAPPPANAKKAGCCNTCAEVRDAYADASWSFGRGEGVEQCQREHYAEHLDAQRKEGCRVEGDVRINKVVGNFHFAPGKSFSNGNLHVHDLENYLRDDAPHSFTHDVHSLRFGPKIPEDAAARFRGPGYNANHNPLDDSRQVADDRSFNFMYFIKVVPTAYLPLGWEKRTGYEEGATPNFKFHDFTAMGHYGRTMHGTIETHQYSVTKHKRSLGGGSDAEEGHKERLHARGGIPGVFFSYDISPMKVINREVRTKNFSAFLVGVCAVIGGTLTVAAAVDRALYEGTQRVRKLHQG